MTTEFSNTVTLAILSLLVFVQSLLLAWLFYLVRRLERWRKRADQYDPSYRLPEDS